MTVFPGRYTAEMDDSFVVFLIGSQVNTWRALSRFRWIGQAMNTMMTALYQNPEHGFLGGESYFRLNPPGSILVSYWRSFEDLERFAHNQSDPHLEPWRRFNREIGASGEIGVWHETYLVQAGQYEVVYGNMPRFGLARAGQHVAVTGHSHTARGRITAGAGPVQI